ncbi:hypothetical protein LCGC14_0821710 [marine sediment metagenome]|uniref:Uncharacterized protein n=1 Tax=marine sediment metagenome TaxID=412755 RepID=A0A0F9SR42_9ZZZZ
MTKDGHDGYIWYAQETSFGVLANDQTWTRLLEVETVSGRGPSQEVKDIRRHGKRGRAGSPRGKRDEDPLVFDVYMVDDAEATNTYDVFLQSIFNESYDVLPDSYAFLIADVEDPTGATTDLLEYYYGCMLDEIEITIEEGEPLKISLSFIRKYVDMNSAELYNSADFSIDCTGEVVTFADDNPDTITRATNSWSADGVKVGDIINITNSTSNNFAYTVASITTVANPDDTITLIGGDTIVAETNSTLTIAFKAVGILIDATGNTITFVEGGGSADTITRANGSWLTDGLVDGAKFTVINSTSNDATYTIDTVDATTITLIVADDVVDETNTTETELIFDSVQTYKAYPSVISYLLWSDVSLTKSGGDWDNVGVVSNISSFTFSVAQGGEKKFRINQSKLPKDVHFGEFVVSGSMTVDYDNFEEIGEVENERSGDIIVAITPTAGLVATITLVNSAYEGAPYDSEVNSLITIDVDFSSDSATFN